MIALRGVDDSSGAARTVGVLYFWDFMEFSLVSPRQDFRFAFFRTLHTSSRSGTLATSPRPQARSSAPERKKALPRHGVITLCAWPSHYGCAKAQKKRLITLAVKRSKDLARLSFLSGWTSGICVGGCESPLEDRRSAMGGPVGLPGRGKLDDLDLGALPNLVRWRVSPDPLALEILEYI